MKIDPQAVQIALDFISTFKNWISAGAITLCVWFIVRFVTKREKFEENIDRFKSEMKKETNEFKNKVDRKVEDALKKVSDAATKFTEQIDGAKKLSTDMGLKTFEFQERLLRDLSRMSVDLSAISSQIKHAEDQVVVTAERMNLLYDQVDNLHKRVSEHQNSLGLGAKAFMKFDKEINNMKSEIVQINDDLKLIKTKKH